MSSIKYSDKSLIYGLLKPWLREGLLLSNGTKWQERRKILTPAFHFNILKQICEIINENSKQLVDNIKKNAGRPIDVLPVMSEFTLNSICGQKFAITKVIQEFELVPITRPEDINFDADLVLRNNGPVLVNFIKRQK